MVGVSADKVAMGGVRVSAVNIWVDCTEEIRTPLDVVVAAGAVVVLRLLLGPECVGHTSRGATVRVSIWRVLPCLYEHSSDGSEKRGKGQIKRPKQIVE